MSGNLLSSATKHQLYRSLLEVMQTRHPEKYSMMMVADGDFLDLILVQFMALGWVEVHTSDDCGSGVCTYYSLTKKGIDKMLEQKALKKSDFPIVI